MNLMQKYRELLPEVDDAMTPTRQQSLKQAINNTAETTVAEIIKIGKWKDSPASRAAEQRIDTIEKDVLAGRGKLIDFKQACEKWKALGTTDLKSIKI